MSDIMIAVITSGVIGFIFGFFVAAVVFAAIAVNRREDE